MPPILHSMIEAVAFVIMATAFFVSGRVFSEIMRDEPAQRGEQG